MLENLITEEVLKILKTKLSAEDIADLICEQINPHRPLTVQQKARLAGKTERCIRDRVTRTVAKRK